MKIRNKELARPIRVLSPLGLDKITFAFRPFIGLSIRATLVKAIFSRDSVSPFF